LVDSIRPHYSAKRLLSSKNTLNEKLQTGYVSNRPVIAENSNDFGK